MVEEVLSDLAGRVFVGWDKNAGMLYNPNRLELLQTFYGSLAVGGKFFVYMDAVRAYAAMDAVLVGEKRRRMPLDKYLQRRYPTVIRPYSHTVTFGSQTRRSRVLLIKHDPDVPVLRPNLELVDVDEVEGPGGSILSSSVFVPRSSAMP